MAKAFFLKRLNDHVQYLKQIEATLAGTGDFEGSSHFDSKLGQWLYGDGAKQVAELQNSKALELFNNLFEAHEHFHIVSKQVLLLNKANDEQGVQIAMTKMHKLSHILMKNLLELDTFS